MRGRLWIALAAVVALVVGLAIWVNTRDEAPVAAPGDGFQIIDSEVINAELPGDQVEIHLPWKVVTVTVGEQRESVPSREDETGVPGAPDDGGFLPVRVEGQALAPDPVSLWDWSQKMAWPTPRLTIDGVEARLPGLDAHFGIAATSGTWYVATEGDPENIEFAISLGDHTETFDLRDGEEHVAWAQEFDHETVTHTRFPCKQESWTAGYAGDYGVDLQGCQMTSLTTTAYVDGLGWAPAGKEYVVAQASAYESSGAEWTAPDGRRATYDLTNPRIGFRLDGAAPVRLADDRVDRTTTRPVFLVDQGSAPRALEMIQTYRGFPDDVGAPTAPRIVRTLTIPLDGAGS